MLIAYNLQPVSVVTPCLSIFSSPNWFSLILSLSLCSRKGGIIKKTCTFKIKHTSLDHYGSLLFSARGVSWAVWPAAFFFPSPMSAESQRRLIPPSTRCRNCSLRFPHPLLVLGFQHSVKSTRFVFSMFARRQKHICPDGYWSKAVTALHILIDAHKPTVFNVQSQWSSIIDIINTSW